MTRPIVVGVDGSPGAAEATRYAAAIAERRHATLTLVYVLEPVFYGYGPLGFAGSYAISEERLRESAAKLLEEAVADIESAHPSLKVDSRLETGGAAARLIDESAEALITVLGSRGMGGFASLMLGSVSTQVAAYGHGPIVVVRPATLPDGPVLVGFDGSTGAGAALQFGVQEALSRGVPLVVANIYWEQPLQPDQQPGRQPRADPRITARHHAQQVINDALELPSHEHPELRYDIRTIHSLNPAHSLVEESAQAGLTVVGSRGLGGFTGLLLGSVSRTLIHHATGPVAVVHPAQQ
jgi:nucleotide-binding universal stress UspA family protein